MLFSSITFLVFFLPCTLVFYYALPNRIYKNCVLLFASLLFYAWGEPKFIFLMIASIVFNYNIGLRLGEKENANRKLLLALGIFINIGILFIFKYLGFSCGIINRILNSLHIKALNDINLIMPIGISFYTFQEISYLVDVYRKSELSQKNLLNLALYITFFPQLIAGPIVRYHDINEQIENRGENLSLFAQGAERFIVGLSKKVLLANSFALVCDRIYGADFFTYGSYAAWIAAFAYTLQIYYDFSGYSDMAIGLARMFGFNLQENFNYPYAASSITDFWKRWHISLTNFFRDYLYIPLGGNRKGKVRTILNRYIVFFITGLWHGAAFNFIIWGLLHGTLMTIERLFNNKKERKAIMPLAVLHRIITLIFILFLWVLFRNGTIRSVKMVLKMFGINYSTLWGDFHPLVINEILLLNIDTKFYILSAIGILFCFPWWRSLKRYFASKFIVKQSCENIALGIKYIALICLFILCYANLADNSYNPFIYFRF